MHSMLNIYFYYIMLCDIVKRKDEFQMRSFRGFEDAGIRGFREFLRF